MEYKKLQQGFSLVEVLLAIALFALFVTSFVGIIIYAQQTLVLSGQQVRATFLAEEGLAAIRNIRDESFANLPDGVFGIQRQGGIWVISGNTDSTDIFVRSISVVSVSTTSKDIISTVAWNQSTQLSGSVTLTSRLTNWRGN